MQPSYLDPFIAVMVNVVVRLALGPGPHSGMGRSPMYGDYEAQRHWMEITVNLKPREWYTNTSNNDLLYWGLDYPPLTAYHSYVMGSIASIVNGSWIELHRSRGMEDYGHKVFMRLTVISVDVLLLFPILWILVRDLRGKFDGFESKAAWFLFLGLYPGLLVVDHAHFQYNNVSLGLFLGSVLALVRGRIALGSTLFALALNYKQMELYHALPIFFYILGSIVDESLRTRNQEDGGLARRQIREQPRRGRTVKFDFKRVATGVLKAGFSVVAVFALLWAPFYEDIPQVIRRTFPFNRGLFEDKVANFWCATSPFIKWHRLFSGQTMVRLCGLTTLLVALPSSVFTFLKPTQNQFSLALVNTSLAFFLCSYHVHEKSILLATTPAYLLLSRPEYRRVVWHFLLIAMISLHPLAVKDETQLLFLPMCFAYYYAVSYCHCGDDPGSIRKISNKENSSFLGSVMNILSKYYNFLFHLSIIFGFLLTLLPALFSPPPKLPDFFTMLLCIYCSGLFVCFLGVFYEFQIADFKSKSKSA